MGREKSHLSASEIVTEAEWESLLQNLIKKPGTALIIGETDSGKSTLIRYLIKRLTSLSSTAALVDADIGQSSLGLPGTICMKYFMHERDISGFRFERMSFLGTTNPALVIPLMIGTTKRMVDACRKKTDFTLVDTTGLVSGNAGRALKTGKIMAVNPEHLIAVTRQNELDHILKPAKGINVHRMRAAREARKRSRRARILYREKKLEDYFSRPLFDHKPDEGRVRYFYHTRPFSLKDHEIPRGTVTGLDHGGYTVALGIVTACAGGDVLIRSPIRSMKGIDRIVLGDMRFGDPV